MADDKELDEAKKTEKADKTENNKKSRKEKKLEKKLEKEKENPGEIFINMNLNTDDAYFRESV